MAENDWSPRCSMTWNSALVNRVAPGVHSTRIRFRRSLTPGSGWKTSALATESAASVTEVPSPRERTTATT